MLRETCRLILGVYDLIDERAYYKKLQEESKQLGINRCKLVYHNYTSLIDQYHNVGYDEDGWAIWTMNIIEPYIYWNGPDPDNYEDSICLRWNFTDKQWTYRNSKHWNTYSLSQYSFIGNKRVSEIMRKMKQDSLTQFGRYGYDF